MVPLLIWLATAVCVLVGFKWLQGDLLLVLKKPIPMDAWVDKRVWVIGASQVCCFVCSLICCARAK